MSDAGCDAAGHTEADTRDILPIVKRGSVREASRCDGLRCEFKSRTSDPSLPPRSANAPASRPRNFTGRFTCSGLFRFATCLQPSMLLGASAADVSSIGGALSFQADCNPHDVAQCGDLGCCCRSETRSADVLAIGWSIKVVVKPSCSRERTRETWMVWIKPVHSGASIHSAKFRCQCSKQTLKLQELSRCQIAVIDGRLARDRHDISQAWTRVRVKDGVGKVSA
ncbi:uncharacterized protein BDZ83DRAFT_112407 [Colletotrichum acutatum]|uniref:Uncharacterized protein n=1 Tax=Glomerella acutata TaxID=27357 RepID=A0AAD8XIY8_GLOAC|nr:uncharacterized protein BDZ83DRAFT_112407 [Colletotrichum acutatum]KAK1728551.1 hypothetical protein BDZ83DRAFT_112407 [Colletotrichum acutatum]